MHCIVAYSAVVAFSGSLGCVGQERAEEGVGVGRQARLHENCFGFGLFFVLGWGMRERILPVSVMVRVGDSSWSWSVELVAWCALATTTTALLVVFFWEKPGKTPP